MAKKDLYTKEQRDVADDIVTWAALERLTGVKQGTLTTWFRSGTRTIGGTPYTMRDLSVAPDHRPPLFLASVVVPILRNEKLR